ncbi:unnamed protein product [Amoebophrya sp. A120]|nr:unnamed protein product [Amoebophrya sp. A120]|eukprot:GSA120T00020236001.1
MTYAGGNKPRVLTLGPSSASEGPEGRGDIYDIPELYRPKNPSIAQAFRCLVRINCDEESSILTARSLPGLDFFLHDRQVKSDQVFFTEQVQFDGAEEGVAASSFSAEEKDFYRVSAGEEPDFLSTKSYDSYTRLKYGALKDFFSPPDELTRTQVEPEPQPRSFLAARDFVVSPHAGGSGTVVQENRRRALTLTPPDTFFAVAAASVPTSQVTVTWKTWLGRAQASFFESSQRGQSRSSALFGEDAQMFNAVEVSLSRTGDIPVVRIAVELRDFVDMDDEEWAAMDEDERDLAGEKFLGQQDWMLYLCQQTCLLSRGFAVGGGGQGRARSDDEDGASTAASSRANVDDFYCHYVGLQMHPSYGLFPRPHAGPSCFLFSRDNPAHTRPTGPEHPYFLQDHYHQEVAETSSTAVVSDAHRKWIPVPYSNRHTNGLQGTSPVGLPQRKKRPVPVRLFKSNPTNVFGAKGVARGGPGSFTLAGNQGRDLTMPTVLLSTLVTTPLLITVLIYVFAVLAGGGPRKEQRFL